MSEIFKPNTLKRKEIVDLENWQLLVAACHFGPQMGDCVRLNYGYRFDGKTIFCVDDGYKDISLDGDIEISKPEEALRSYVLPSTSPPPWQTIATNYLQGYFADGEDESEEPAEQNTPKLTYEELKDILEMSEIFNLEEAGEVVEAMNLRKYPPTIGNLLAYFSHSGDWTLTIEDTDILIKKHHQYTSGKLEEDNITLRAKLGATYELVDGLKDMLDGGRLTGSDIPDDFDWVHQQIEKIERNRA